MMKQSSIKPQTAKGLRMREPAPFWHCRENRTCILTFRTQLESDEHFYSVHDTDSVKVFINGQKLTIPKVKTRQGHVFLCPVNACPFYNRDAAQMRLHSTREHSNGEVWVSESTNPAPTPGVIGSGKTPGTVCDGMLTEYSAEEVFNVPRKDEVKASK